MKSKKIVNLSLCFVLVLSIIVPFFLQNNMRTVTAASTNVDVKWSYYFGNNKGIEAPPCIMDLDLDGEY